MNSRCITWVRKVGHPAMRLFLFHCAGGSHLMYRGWERAFPADWDLGLIDAPGRARLADHPPADSAAGLARFVLPAITPLLDIPFALFGHSMGGLVAYDLTLRFAIAGLPQPVWVGVSARRAPEETPSESAILHHAMSDSDLRRGLRAMGGTPPAVLSEPKLWAIMAPVLRADLRIGDTWQRPPTPDFAAPPLSVFGGTEDSFAPPDRIEAWRHHSPRFAAHLFPGGHFYLHEHLPELSRHIVADVEAAGGRRLAA